MSKIEPLTEAVINLKIICADSDCRVLWIVDIRGEPLGVWFATQPQLLNMGSQLLPKMCSLSVHVIILHSAHLALCNVCVHFTRLCQVVFLFINFITFSASSSFHTLFVYKDLCFSVLPLTIVASVCHFIHSVNIYWPCLHYKSCALES